jgi:hypothetical protein
VIFTSFNILGYKGNNFLFKNIYAGLTLKGLKFTYSCERVTIDCKSCWFLSLKVQSKKYVLM